MTIGPDGAISVGELKGFPFRPGSSNIWQIKPNADGARCSVKEKDPSRKCSLYKTGFTAIQDIAFDRSNGRVYVYQLARTVWRRSRPGSRPACSGGRAARGEASVGGVTVAPSTPRVSCPSRVASSSPAVVHMDREALNDYPLGLYDVTVTIRTFVPDREIAWTVVGVVRPPIGHV